MSYKRSASAIEKNKVVWTTNLVLKNELKEVKLEALVLPNVKAETVLNGITAILD